MNGRRKFIKYTGMASIGFFGLKSLMNGAGGSLLYSADNPSYGYGPLVKDPKGIFHLPKGFSYKIISKQGEKMADGFYLPGKPDGMAAFPGKNGRTILVRNHEIAPHWHKDGAFGDDFALLKKLDKGDFYDYGGGKKPMLGGTTTAIFNNKTQEIEKQFISLAGTERNCAGGPTPWGSWLTCEESIRPKGDGFEKDHGYVFEVPASEDMKRAKPLPIKAMGRFNHEAVAVDPATGIVYQTEDQHEGLIYRYIPNKKGELHKGGKLQALAIKGEPKADLRNWKESVRETVANIPLAVEWIDMDNPESPGDSMRFRGFKKGAARFARGEGMWYGNDEIYWACTNGGKKSSGQVFRYKPSQYEGTDKEKDYPGKVELFIEPNDNKLLKYCDNLTVSPWGDLMLVEDHSDPNIVGVTPNGEYYMFGDSAHYKSELAGICFSPDGDTMFVNIQHDGLTVAITGPFKKRS